MAKSKTTEAPAAAKGKGKKAKEEEAAPEENTVDEDVIRGMTKPQLVAWIEEHDLDTKPADHKKLADLKDAVIAELSDEDEENEDEDEGEGEGETLDVSEMDLDGLLAVIKDKGLSIKPKEAKAMKLKKLRKAVEEALAEGGDDDDEEEPEPEEAPKSKGKKAAKEEKTPKGSAKSGGKGSSGKGK